jgi:hypothetical protein
MRRLLALILLVLCTSSCYAITGYPEQPKMIDGPSVTSTVVTVDWVRGVDEMQRLCSPELGTDKIWYACASVSRIGNTTFCTIHAIMPKDFNDEVLLAVLGHEFYHCLGATHGR